MRLNRLTVYCLCVTLLSIAAPTFAQDFRGRINGTVTDNTGAILPGVTVTATSPALMQPQVQVSGVDGTFRFLALPPGVYEVGFELAGFTSYSIYAVDALYCNRRLGVSRRRLWSAFPYLRRNWLKLHKHRVKRWLRRRVGLPEWPRAGARGG